MAADPDLAALSDAYSGLVGAGFALQNEEKRDGGFPYGELRLRLKAEEPAKLGLDPGKDAAVLDAIGDILTFRWAVSQGRAAMTTGDAAALRRLVARRAAPSPLAGDPVFAAFAKTLPPGVVMVGYFSLSRAMELAANAAGPAARGAEGQAPAAGILSSLDPDRFGSWYAYAAERGEPGAASIEAGLHVPARDLGSLAALAASFRKSGEAAPDAQAKEWAAPAEPPTGQ